MKKMIGSLVDEKGKIGIVIFSVSENEAEEIIKEKIFLAFKKGLVMLAWKGDELVTVPSIVELMERGLI